MQGPDTASWGQASIKAGRDRVNQAHAHEPEPDWQALREKAEMEAVLERAAAAFKIGMPAQPAEPVAAPPEDETLRAQRRCAEARAEVEEAERKYEHAASDAEAELAAERYERALAALAEAEAWHEGTLRASAAPVPAQAARTRAPIRDAEFATSVFFSPSITPAAPAALDAVPTWDATDLDAAPGRQPTWLPRVLAAVAVIALGVGGVVLYQHQAAEAERTARTEKLLEEMRRADAERATETAREAARQAAIAAQAPERAQAAAPQPGSVAALLAQGLQNRAAADTQVRTPKAGKTRKAQPIARRRIAARAIKRRVSRPAAAPRLTRSDSPTGSARDPLFGL